MEKNRRAIELADLDLPTRVHPESDLKANEPESCSIGRSRGPICLLRSSLLASSEVEP